MDNPNRYFILAYTEALLVEVYAFIPTLPRSEKYNLVSQMRRSATSIDDNIREGASSQGDAATLPFLYHSNRSAGELYGQFRKCRLLSVGDQRAAKLLFRKSGRLLTMVTRLIKAKEARLGIDNSSGRPRRKRPPRRTE
jgi:four helix bundle protein